MHLILGSRKGKKLSNIIRDFRGFTSKNLITAIKNNPRESRKQWLLNYFRNEGSKRKSVQSYQLWKRNYHPVELDDTNLFNEKLDYIHQNPVRACFVFDASQYVYSSTSNYSGKSGLIDVEIV